MYSYEQDLWGRDFKYVAGVDEVGRGCLFGDVVAAAVVLDQKQPITGLKDSKKLTPMQREQLYDEILNKAIAVAVGRIEAGTVDSINIKRATIQAMEQAVIRLQVEPDIILIDAERISTVTEQISIIKGDQLSASIAAASIVAKVTRDRLCLEWGERYPAYRIEKHKGYGTKEHIEMLKMHGATPMHRKTFLKNILPKD